MQDNHETRHFFAFNGDARTGCARFSNCGLRRACTARS